MSITNNNGRNIDVSNKEKGTDFFLNHETMYFSSEVSLLVANISTRN